MKPMAKAASKRGGKGKGKGGRKTIGKRGKKSKSRNDPGRVKNTDLYEVEAAVAKRVVDGNTQYFLKWKGWPSSSNTWEPLDNISCPKVIQAYERKMYFLSLEEDAESNETKLEKPQLSGFQKGLKASRVLDAIHNKEDDSIYLLIKWENADYLEFVRAAICHKLIPEMVCDFYLSQMKLDKDCVIVQQEILDSLENGKSRQTAGNKSDEAKVEDFLEVRDCASDEDLFEVRDDASEDLLEVRDGGNDEDLLEVREDASEDLLEVRDGGNDGMSADEN